MTSVAKVRRVLDQLEPLNTEELELLRFALAVRLLVKLLQELRR